MELRNAIPARSSEATPGEEAWAREGDEMRVDCVHRIVLDRVRKRPARAGARSGPAIARHSHFRQLGRQSGSRREMGGGPNQTAPAAGLHPIPQGRPRRLGGVVRRPACRGQHGQYRRALVLDEPRHPHLLRCGTQADRARVQGARIQGLHDAGIRDLPRGVPAVRPARTAMAAWRPRRPGCGRSPRPRAVCRLRAADQARVLAVATNPSRSRSFRRGILAHLYRTGGALRQNRAGRRREHVLVGHGDRRPVPHALMGSLLEKRFRSGARVAGPRRSSRLRRPAHV